MDGNQSLEQGPNTLSWADLLKTPNWTERFQTLCEELKITDALTVWSQIETWMSADVLPEDIPESFRSKTSGLKTFLKKVMMAAQQATQEPKRNKEDSLYHRLERSATYKQIYGIDPQGAPSLLIFASARKTGGLEERLEIEVGRFGAAQLTDPPDSYFYRQGNAELTAHLKRDNGILARQTSKAPENAQYARIESTSLRNLGRYLKSRRSFDFHSAQQAFSRCLESQKTTDPHLDLLTFSNLAAQLEVYCPTIYTYAQNLIQASVTRENSAESGLYFLGSIMRHLRQKLGTSAQVKAAIEPNVMETHADFQDRAQALLAINQDSWEAALQKIAHSSGIEPKIIGRLI